MANLPSIHSNHNFIDNYSQANELYENKEFEKSFRMIASSSISMGILSKFDPFEYILWKMKILGTQAEICFNQNNPNYDSYLFYYTSSICYEILHQIAQLPTNHLFFKWRLESIENPSKFFKFHNNPDFDKALKKVKKFSNKKLITEKLFYFCFDELPIIYGIRKELLDPIELNKYFKEKVIDLYKLIKEFEELNSRDLSLINVNIGNKVRTIFQGD